MVILLGLAAAALYGSGDFLGGMATRRLQVLPVLLLADAAGLIVALVIAAMSMPSCSLREPNHDRRTSHGCYGASRTRPHECAASSTT